jgi:hypothetical protein
VALNNDDLDEDGLLDDFENGYRDGFGRWHTVDPYAIETDGDGSRMGLRPGNPSPTRMAPPTSDRGATRTRRIPMTTASMTWPSSSTAPIPSVRIPTATASATTSTRTR